MVIDAVRHDRKKKKKDDGSSIEQREMYCEMPTKKRGKGSSTANWHHTDGPEAELSH